VLIYRFGMKLLPSVQRRTSFLRLCHCWHIVRDDVNSFFLGRHGLNWLSDKLMKLLDLMLGLFICYGGYQLAYEAFQGEFTTGSFFALAIASIMLFGGVSVTMLAIKKLQGKEED
jgi:hypothetical protein